MQVIRSEIRTGILVILTLGALVALVLYIGAPGVFKSLNTYYVHVDNASGIKPGAAVNLAGRKVGQITNLVSPVPLVNRPKNKPNYEVLVTVRAEADAKIYKECNVRMVAYGLLSELVIDFTNGNEDSGLATNGHVFIGERDATLTELAPQIIGKLDPLIEGAKEALAELKIAVTNIGAISAPDSQFNLALGRFRVLGDNLVLLTNPDGSFSTKLNTSMASLETSMANIEKITTDIQNDDLKVTLANFRSASVKLNNVVAQADSTVSSLNSTVAELGPSLVSTGKNASQLTDTLKRQPWRIIWPTTKKYPEGDVEVRKALPTSKRKR